MGVHQETQIWEGSSQKKQYIGELPKRGKGLGQFADLRVGAHWKRGGGVFEGRLISWCTLCIICVSQEEHSLIASNQQICSFNKWIIFDRKRNCGK